ncbi:MAG: FtsX-like permease family protein [Ruminococcaceae bacterium]|nr:FtsX-like permease family protein [Oscillospiraceae bacterium]
MITAFRMALRSIGSNKLRAALTMLGIIIGVMALVVLVSLVNSATTSVTDAVSSLGANLMTVTIEDDKGYPLTLELLDEWEEEERFIGSIAPYASASATAKYEGNNDSLTLYGTTPDYYEIEGLNLSMGRFLKQTDVDNHSRICVINETAAEELIGFTDCVGKEISIDGMKFMVVGVLEDSDSSLTASFSSGTLVAYIPYTMLPRLSDTATTTVTTFSVSAAEESNMEQVETLLTFRLLERFEEDEDAYTISTVDALEDTMGSITSILSILLGGIAAISLVVGGIGIMNIMLVTVTERTREIGIRKAIGASRGTILRQFLIEAIVLCMMGCAIGIFLSWTILRVVSVITSSLEMSFRLQSDVVWIAVAFCFLIGLIFGLYPANKAAKMKPIDALHYNG